MTSQQIEVILARMENAGTIEKKDVCKSMKGDYTYVQSYDFGIITIDEESEGSYMEMSMWDYDFLLHASNDIRDLVEALEEVQEELRMHKDATQMCLKTLEFAKEDL